MGYDEIDDAPLAPALVKTLSDAQQEVPDWLAQAAEQSKLGGNLSYNPHARAGGRDNREHYRDNNFRRDRNDNYRGQRNDRSGPIESRDRGHGSFSNQNNRSAMQNNDSDGEWD